MTASHCMTSTSQITSEPFPLFLECTATTDRDTLSAACSISPDKDNSALFVDGILFFAHTMY